MKIIKARRVYINIYFKNGITEKRTKRDLTIAFYDSEPLYKACKKLSSDQIKSVLNINSYKLLAKKAIKENRSLSNYIKHRLKEKLLKKKSG